jgi:hypothetical protein
MIRRRTFVLSASLTAAFAGLVFVDGRALLARLADLDRDGDCTAGAAHLSVDGSTHLAKVRPHPGVGRSDAFIVRWTAATIAKR